MMKSYLAELHQATVDADQKRELNAAKVRSGDTRVSPEWKPLMEQIHTLMRSLPPAQRNRPWTMEELCLRLSGKFKKRPHPMHVGTALRELGWVTKRDWTQHGGGRRYWLPTSAVDRIMLKNSGI